ncbi:hypothetical protein, partial [Salmonella sp. s54925]|uniref:hypothetical protein n=1 Tax=Salmonella sp. s54925 TaxID=3159674 RepID=UPI00397FC5AF
QRNSGLFTADQKLKRNVAKYTRQNPNGQRYGYECPEERDYYPYFYATDWFDIAILANKMADCPYYKSESFNTKPKGECMELHNHLNRKKTEAEQKTWDPKTNPWKHTSTYNNKED